MFKTRSIVCVASTLLSWQVHAADFSSPNSATADVAFSEPATSYTFTLSAPETIPLGTARNAVYGTIRLTSTPAQQGLPAQRYRWGLAWDTTSTQFQEVITNDSNNHRHAKLKGQRDNSNRITASIWYGNVGDSRSIIIGDDRYWVNNVAVESLTAQITGQTPLTEQVNPDTYKMVINAVVYRE